MSSKALTFHVKAECNVSKARVGLMKLPHYEVKTPVFMPVGTQVRNLPCRIRQSVAFRILYASKIQSFSGDYERAITRST